MQGLQPQAVARQAFLHCQGQLQVLDQAQVGAHRARRELREEQTTTSLLLQGLLCQLVRPSGLMK